MAVRDRTNIDKHINFIKDEVAGNLAPIKKPFEVVIKRSRVDFKLAVKIYAELKKHLPTVYLYKTGNKYFIEYRAYFRSYNAAKYCRENVKELIETVGEQYGGN